MPAVYHGRWGNLVAASDHAVYVVTGIAGLALIAVWSLGAAWPEPLRNGVRGGDQARAIA